MSDQSKVVCGRCKRDPEIVTNADGKEEAVCPGCGIRDNLEDAKRIARDQVFHEAQLAMQGAIRQGVGSDKLMQLKAKPVPRRTFRWHAAEA